MLEVPGYRIVRELGRGGMAAVFLAEQCSLGRQVALKVLAREAGADRDLRQRFLREGMVAAGLHHRHIVAVHDVGGSEGLAWIAMEYLPLGPVSSLCGQMAPDQALRCIAEIAWALDLAHAHGIVHRDVKPGNILRHEDGAFMLSDFGVAHVAAASAVLTRRGQIAGTPAYMAPELWRDAPVDGRADFYSLGCVLYDLLVGHPPYGGSDGWAIGMQHMSAPVPQLPEAWQPLQGLLARLLAKDPADRIASGEALGRHIDALRRDGVLLPPPVPGGAATAAPPHGSSAARHEWPFLDAPATDPATAPAAVANARPGGDGGRSAVRFALRGVPGAVRGAILLALLLLTATLAILHRAGDGVPPMAGAVGTGDAFDAYQRGLRLLERGSGSVQLEQALDWFRQALAADPALARAHAGTCRAEMRLHELTRDTTALVRAAAACDRARLLEPELPELALADGHLARSAGDAQAAAAHYAQALDSPLTQVEAQLGLAQLAAERGDPAAALEHHQAARLLDRGNWRVHLARGTFHYLQGDLEQAAQAYREATRLAPDNVASPWTNLGAVYLAQHRYPQAAEALYRSISVEPSHAALNNLATVRFRLGDFAEAVALFRRAVALAPTDHRGWGSLGDAASELAGGAGEAKQSYRRAADEASRQLEVNPDDADVRGALAWYLANLGEAERARILLRQAEQAAGADALAVRAAQVHARLGDLPGARRSARRALAAGVSREELGGLPVLRPVLADSDARPASERRQAQAVED